MSEAKPQSSHRKERVGEVVSDRMTKTIVVRSNGASSTRVFAR
jgi:ribosomal protein S17